MCAHSKYVHKYAYRNTFSTRKSVYIKKKNVMRVYNLFKVWTVTPKNVFDIIFQKFDYIQKIICLIYNSKTQALFKINIWKLKKNYDDEKSVNQPKFKQL